MNIEGRAVLTEHYLQDGKSLVLINVYCPRADLDNVERLEYKLKFYNALQRRCQSLQQAGKYSGIHLDILYSVIDMCPMHLQVGSCSRRLKLLLWKD